MEALPHNVIVLSGTCQDSTTNKFSRLNKNILEKTAKDINDNIQTLSIDIYFEFLTQLSRPKNAKVVESKDGEFYLIAEIEFNNKNERITLEDGTILIKEDFEGGEPSLRLGFIFSLHLHCDLFILDGLNRISINSESIITFGDFVIGYLGLKTLFPKIHEKITDSVSEILTDNFKKHVKESASNFIKNFNLSTNPKAFVFSIPGDITIEFIIKSENLDDVVSAFSADNIILINSKIEASKKVLNPAKIQFFYTKENKWELNYILTHLGEVIGTEKSCDIRNVAYRELNDKFLNP